MGEWLERLPDAEPEWLCGAGYAQIVRGSDEVPDNTLACVLAHWMGPDEEPDWASYIMDLGTAAAVIAALLESARSRNMETALVAKIDQLRVLGRELPAV